VRFLGQVGPAATMTAVDFMGGRKSLLENRSGIAPIRRDRVLLRVVKGEEEGGGMSM
jgi:hypothetical protein